MERPSRRHRQCLQQGLVVTFIILSSTLSRICQAQTPALDVVGVENPKDYKDNIDAGTNNAYMLTASNLHISGCGLIDKFRFYSRGNGPMKLLVWRPDAGSNYKLIQETEIPATDIGTDELVIYSISNSATVQPGDLIGWWSPTSIVSYNDVPANATADGVQTQVMATLPAVGGTAAWTAAPDITKRYAFGADVKPSDPPLFTNCPTAAVDVPISTGVSDSVLTLSATDLNADDVDLGIGIEIDGTSTYFEVDSTTGNVTVKAPLAVGTETVNFIAKDFCGIQSDVPCSITFNIVNDRPNITSLPVAAVEIREDATDLVPLHNLTFTDPGQTGNVNCDYTVDQPGPFKFDRAADDTYAVTFQENDNLPLNADITSTYHFWFWCNDGTSDSINRTFEVTILQNTPPELTTLPTEIRTSTKNLTKNSLVEDLFPYSTDAENDDLTWSMTCINPATCPLKIDPSTGKVRTTEDLRLHKDTLYSFAVTVSDKWGNATKMTSLVLEDINTLPTLDKPLPPGPVVERFAENTENNPYPGHKFEYTIEATDPDLGDEVNFLVEWEDEAMADYFDITIDKTAKTAKIVSNQALDYEKLLEKFGKIGPDFSFRLNVTAVDSRGERSETGQLHIVVTDDNEPPKFKRKNYHLDANEDTANTDLACPLFAYEDKDLGDYHTFTAACTNGAFQLDPSSSCQGLMTMISQHELDPPSGANVAFEKTTCTITVEDKDGETDTATLEITTREINDNHPELEQTQYAFTATNETLTHSYIGNIGTTIDRDVQQKHKEVTYSLSGGNSGSFTIDENGDIRNVDNMYGIALPKVYRFNVIATDNAGHTDSAPVTVTVLPVPPTTTTTTTTSVYPDVYEPITDYFGDTGNLIWTILAGILGALFLGLLAYTCARCLSTPGACAAFRGGRCFGRGRPSCLGGRKRVGAEARHGPARTQKAPPRANKEAPKRRSRLFDCFDKKDKGEPVNRGNHGARDPDKPDEGLPWEPWRDNFNTRNWVG